jgi:formate/nitrite transporter FocA (FNT family)
MLPKWGGVYFGNFLGCAFAGLLFAIALTGAFAHDAGALGAKVIAVAESKTLAYVAAGWHGWLTAFVKGVLCNWMVALGTVLALSSTSSMGKIAAVWLPVSTFFALALEHSVVNMFVIPTAMMLGADISVGQWLLWNQLPVTLGNLVGGAVLTGLLLHFANRVMASDEVSPEGAAVRV